MSPSSEEFDLLQEDVRTRIMDTQGETIYEVGTGGKLCAFLGWQLLRELYYVVFCYAVFVMIIITGHWFDLARTGRASWSRLYLTRMKYSLKAERSTAA